MRTAIFADIHGNGPAFDAVLADIEQIGVDRSICLGDIVGYGADAKACLDRVRAMNIVVVAGNHDWAVCDRLDASWFNPYALAAIEWTRSQLSDDDIAWLAALEPAQVVGDLTVAHATVHDPSRFDYMTNSYDAYESFQVMSTDIGFVGHSHVPIAFFFDGTTVTYSRETSIAIDDRRMIANPGSVGQPRDEDPRAAYAVFDDQTKSVEIRRVAYDVDAAAQRILDAGLPSILAERLFVGR